MNDDDDDDATLISTFCYCYCYCYTSVWWLLAHGTVFQSESEQLLPSSPSRDN